MTWNVVINSDDCDWSYVELTNDHLFGCVRNICTHPDNYDVCCSEDCCPRKVNKREYQKYEFCQAVDCRYYYHKNVFQCGATGKKECPFTAKEFHHWLVYNGFEIKKNG